MRVNLVLCAYSLGEFDIWYFDVVNYPVGNRFPEFISVVAAKFLMYMY